MRKIVSLCLALALTITTVYYTPAAIHKATPSSALWATVSEATPSSALRATVSEAIPSTAATLSEATPSVAAKFKCLEPDDVPEYYQATKYRGKKIWKFKDRFGETQYRLYGYFTEAVEEPLWYNSDSAGVIEDENEYINLDNEYWEMSPYLYESAEPDWDALTQILGVEMDSVSFKQSKISKPENYDSTDYVTYEVQITKQNEDEENESTQTLNLFYGHYKNVYGESQDTWWKLLNDTWIKLKNNRSRSYMRASYPWNGNAFFYANYPPAFVSNLTANRSANYYLDDPGAAYISMPGSPSKSGYDFLGWTSSYCWLDTDTFSDPIYSSLGFYTPQGMSLKWENNTTAANFFYAAWRLSGQKTITFVEQPKRAYTSKVNRDWVALRSFDSGTNVDLTAFTASKAGYTFTGWYTATEEDEWWKGIGEPITSLTLTQDTKLYAGFAKNVYKVTYTDYLGNTIYTQDVEHGDHISYRPNAEQIANIACPENQEFVGWDVSYTAAVTGEMTVHAKYQSKYSVTINLNGGKYLTSLMGTLSDAPIEAKRPEVGSEIGTIFTGWLSVRRP